MVAGSTHNGSAPLARMGPRVQEWRARFNQRLRRTGVRATASTHWSNSEGAPPPSVARCISPHRRTRRAAHWSGHAWAARCSSPPRAATRSTRTSRWRDTKTGETKEAWMIDVRARGRDGVVRRVRRVAPIRNLRAAERCEHATREVVATNDPSFLDGSERELVRMAQSVPSAFTGIPAESGCETSGELRSGASYQPRTRARHRR